MTAAELQKQIKQMRSFKRKVAKSEERSQELLLKTGIYTREGKLKKVYR